MFTLRKRVERLEETVYKTVNSDKKDKPYGIEYDSLEMDFHNNKYVYYKNGKVVFKSKLDIDLDRLVMAVESGATLKLNDLQGTIPVINL